MFESTLRAGAAYLFRDDAAVRPRSHTPGVNPPESDPLSASRTRTASTQLPSRPRRSH